MANFEFVISDPERFAKSKADQAQTPQELFEKTIAEAFDFFDKDADGRLSSIEQFTNCLRALGCRPSTEALQRWWETLSRAKVPASIDRPVPLNRKAEEDMSKQRAVWRIDFLTAAPTLLKESVVNKRDGTKAMDAFDTDKDGYVSLQELESVLGVMGNPLPADEVQAILKDAEVNERGLVHVKSFMDMIFKFGSSTDIISAEELKFKDEDGDGIADAPDRKYLTGRDVRPSLQSYDGNQVVLGDAARNMRF